MTKGELYEIYQPPVYNMVETYNNIVYLMFVCVTYAPLLPIGLVYVMIGLSLYYFAEKVSILRHRKIVVNVDHTVAKEMIELAEYLLPLYCASNVVFDYMLTDSGKDASVSLYSVFGISLGLLHAILPMGNFNEWLCEVLEGKAEVETDPIYYDAC